MSKLDQIIMLTNRCNSLEVERGSLACLADELKKEVAGLQEQVDMYRKTIQDQGVHLLKLRDTEKKLEQVLAENEKLKVALGGAEERREEFMEHERLFCAERDLLRINNNALKESLDRVKAENEKLKAALDEVKQDRDRWEIEGGANLDWVHDLQKQIAFLRGCLVEVGHIDPCPFCGSHNVHVVDAPDQWVKCDDCGANGPEAACATGAIRKWNGGLK